MTAGNKSDESNEEDQLSQNDQPEKVENENSFSSKMVSEYKIEENRIIVVDILIEFLRYTTDVQNRSYDDWEQQLKLKLNC